MANKKKEGTKLESLEQLLIEQLKDLSSAEQQLVKALPAIAQKASHAALKRAIQGHLVETKNQVERLKSIEEQLDTKLSGKVCKAMQGLIEEGNEALEIEGDETLIDLSIVAAAQRVEHYEIAGYGNARMLAEQLKLDEVADLLQETLDEEKAADQKLSDVSESDLLPNVDSDSERSEEEDEDEDQLAR